MRTIAIALVCLAGMLAAESSGQAAEAAPDRPVRSVKDLKPDFAEDDAAVFSMPVALAAGKGALYVLDAQEAALKVFTRAGRYLKDIGRQGQGPGEFNLPSCLALSGEKIVVADSFNNRVQILDAGGAYLGGFQLEDPPHQVLALGGGRYAVSRRPRPRERTGRLVRCYDETGTLLGEAVDVLGSPDPIYDAFRNELVIMDGGDGTFYAARKNDERTISHYDGGCRLLGRVEAESVRPPRSVALPLKSGERDLTPVHWDCLYREGRFYTLVPEPDGERDIGPGRIVGVLDGAGRLVEEIALPAPVKKIHVEGDRIYAVDAENALRIFEVLR